MTVRLGSPFNEIASAGEITLEIPRSHAAGEGMTLGRLLDEVGDRVEVLRRLFRDAVQRKYFICAINGVKAGESDRVEAGDIVEVSSPILGG